MVLQTYKIGDLAKVQGGFAFKSADFKEAGIPVLKITNVQDRRIELNNLSYVDPSIVEGLERFFVKSGDVLISMTGNGPQTDTALVGRTARYNGPDNTFLLNQRVGRFLVNETLVRKRFLYFCISRPEMNRELALRSTGSANQANINATTIENFEISIPDLATQDKILKILGEIDDKMELNNQINKNLEAMAKATFKEWFIDFGPVKAKAEGRKPFGMDDETAALFPDSFEESEIGQVPTSWSLQPITDLFEVNPKYSLSKGKFYPYTEMKDLPTNASSVLSYIDREFKGGSKFSNGDTLIARITPCLENGKTAFVDYLPENSIGWGSTEFIVLRSRPGIPLPASYLLARLDGFRKHLILNMSGTSGRQRVPESCLEKFKMAKPTPEIWQSFEKIIYPLFKKIRACTDENNKLIEARDLLLPKLISGEIHLKDLQ